MPKLSRPLWVPQSPSSSGFELVVCAATQDVLYLMIIGPVPDELGAPEEITISVSTADGEDLQFWGQTRTVSKRRGRIYFAEFEAPQPTAHLQVSLVSNGNQVLTAHALPLTAESA